MSPPGYVLHHRFDDVDEFAAATRGWDLDFRQIERGRCTIGLSQVATASAILTHCSLGRAIEQRGSSPEGFRTLGFPVYDDVRLRWRGRDLDGAHCMVFPRGGELDSISGPGFEVFTLSVAEEALAAAAHRRGLTSVDELLPATSALRCEAPARERVRATARALCEAASQPRSLSSTAFRLALEHDLVELVLDAMAQGSPAPSRSSAPARRRLLATACEVIRARAHEPLTVTDLVQATGASVRTLRYSFMEAFGVPPKQYLQSYRLVGVRRALRSQDPGATPRTVAAAANAWGFWHMGQFARDYRLMFGELPSRTLDRALTSSSRSRR